MHRSGLANRYFSVALPAAGLLCVLFASDWVSAAPLTITSSKTLQGNHSGSIVIKGNNVTLNCNGNKILWAGSSNAAKCLNRFQESVTCGIKVAGYDNPKIINCVVWDQNYGFGVWVADSNAPQVLGGRVLLASNAGVHLIRTTGAYINGIDADTNLEGVEMFDNVDTAIFSSTLRNSADAGIDDEWSSGGSFEQNYLIGNYFGYFGWHSNNLYFYQNHVNNNDHIGTEIQYATGFIVDGDDVGRNGNYGIVIGSSQYGTVMNSIGKLNSVCDAYQERVFSRNITWSNNTFAKACGGAR